MAYITENRFYGTRYDQTLIERLKAMLAVRKQRKMLHTLTDEQLEDIGLTRHQVKKECAKPFWK